MAKTSKNENGNQMPTSMKTAFVRVSFENETSTGHVSYTYEEIKNKVEEWNKGKYFKYYMRAHNNEPDDPNPHCHIVLVFDSPTPFENVKSVFPYGKIESAKSVKKCVQYLVHMNDLSKTRYDFGTIDTNDPNIEKYSVKTSETKQYELAHYMRLIENGTIREYNLTEYIPIDLFATNKAQILNGLEFYRRRIMTNKDRNINVIILTGATGTYKTTYAKHYCTNSKKSFCISSSSNDPMQDYKGEDVLILDDIRDSTFKFHDLLKILDNHTNSTVQSRYYNKAFIGDTIIITSSQPISEWYFNLDREDKEQLYRRIGTQMQFTRENIKVFEFNEQTHRYEYVATVPNVSAYTRKDTKRKVIDIMKNMGLDLPDNIAEDIINDNSDGNNDRPLLDLYEEMTRSNENGNVPF